MAKQPERGGLIDGNRFSPDADEKGGRLLFSGRR
jgi:hypothetical protein